MIKTSFIYLSLLPLCLVMTSCRSEVKKPLKPVNLSYNSIFQHFKQRNPAFRDYILLRPESYKKNLAKKDIDKAVFHIADLNNDGIKDAVLTIGKPESDHCCIKYGTRRIVILKGMRNGAFKVVLNNDIMLEKRGLSSKVVNGVLHISNAYTGSAFGTAPDSFYDIKLKIQGDHAIVINVSVGSSWQVESGMPTGTNYEYDFEKMTYDERWSEPVDTYSYKVHKAKGTFRLKRPAGLIFGNKDSYQTITGTPGFIKRGIIKDK